MAKKEYETNRPFASKSNSTGFKVLNGIFRKTLAYDNDLMLVHFFLKKGSKIPMHFHEERQIGYIIRGKLKFLTKNNDFLAKDGDSYLFKSNEKHGALILEDSEVIDVFNPSREDYKISKLKNRKL